MGGHIRPDPAARFFDGLNLDDLDKHSIPWQRPRRIPVLLGDGGVMAWDGDVDVDVEDLPAAGLPRMFAVLAPVHGMPCLHVGDFKEGVTVSIPLGLLTTILRYAADGAEKLAEAEEAGT